MGYITGILAICRDIIKGLMGEMKKQMDVTIS